MAIRESLAEHLKEQLEPLGPISVRRMFGGAGVFLDGLMFAIIIDDALYLKADAATEPDFRAEGLEAFAYAKRTGQTTVMSFWRAPERLLDDNDQMLAWARNAVAVARRKKSAATKSRPSKRQVRLGKSRRKSMKNI